MYQDIILKFPTSIAAGYASDSEELRQYIFENAEKKCIVHYNKSDKYHFEIINAEQQTIHFVAIDNGIYPSSKKQKRCDCAVFNHSTICFIEIKRRTGTIGSILGEAKKQLIETISSVKLDFDKLENYELEAFASLGKGSYSPSLQTSFQDAMLEFELETGAVLYIDDQKAF
ncbi:hypothetical protein BH09BAC1_BH09BAC1_04400 [soil metagenome]